VCRSIAHDSGFEFHGIKKLLSIQTIQRFSKSTADRRLQTDGGDMNMKRASFAVWVLFTALSLCIAAPNAAVAQEHEYEPYVGQQGKDVIWVPTSENLVQAMLNLAKVTSSDYVIDLGSGDGRIVIAAAKRGARAVGFEYNLDMVELSRKNAQEAGVADKATFVNADLFESDFSKATVVTMYLLPTLNKRLRPKILDLKPGTRVVSHSFDMEDWSPDQKIEQDGGTAYLWIVPAKVEGVWKLRTDSGTAELKLAQKFQFIEGTETENGKELAIQNGKIDGDHVTFNVGGSEYSGRVNHNSIQGTVKSNGLERKWSAVRS
jgi:SAM-dependent methyltransferase